MSFLQRAEEFFAACRQLPDRQPPSWPRYFLFCHAIELALKAYLTLHGLDILTLQKKPYGHNLKELLKEAANRGLGSGPLARGDIELLDEAHTKYWPRYPKHDGKPILVIDQFEPYLVELLSERGARQSQPIKTWARS